MVAPNVALQFRLILDELVVVTDRGGAVRVLPQPVPPPAPPLVPPPAGLLPPQPESDVSITILSIENRADAIFFMR